MINTVLGLCARCQTRVEPKAGHAVEVTSPRPYKRPLNTPTDLSGKAVYEIVCRPCFRPQPVMLARVEAQGYFHG